MATNEAISTITAIADSTIGIFTGVPGMPGSADPNGGKQYHVVKQTTNPNEAGLANATTTKHRILGVLQNKPQSVGEAATVAVRGVTLVVVGIGGVSAGDALKVDANGAVITATIGSDADDLIVGLAVSDGAASGLASALLKL